MNIRLDDSLKTKRFNKRDHTLVFTTDKTLHERFTRKDARCVFIIKNGYTAPFKNNVEKGRIVFPYGKKMKISDLYSSSQECNTEKRLERALQLNQLMKKRRTVIKPTTRSKREWAAAFPGIFDDIVLPFQSQSKSFDFSTPKVDSNVEKNGARRILECDKISNNQLHQDVQKYPDTNYASTDSQIQPVIFSPVYLFGKKRYIQPSVYKWRRKPILPSKAQLDDEIDRYMAEVKSKVETKLATSKTEEKELFAQEYYRETEKFLNKDEGELSIL